MNYIFANWITILDFVASACEETELRLLVIKLVLKIVVFCNRIANFSCCLN